MGAFWFGPVVRPVGAGTRLVFGKVDWGAGVECGGDGSGVCLCACTLPRKSCPSWLEPPVPDLGYQLL